MPDYLSTGLSNAQRAASFRKQMADFARGDRLRELREAQHLSQEDAAHEIGVSVKSLRSWEKGGGIRWPNAKSAGTFYGVEPESLVDRELVAADGTTIPQLNRIETKLDEVLDWIESQGAVEVAAAVDPESARADRRSEAEPAASDRHRKAR